jgi:hypothetical protein
MDVDYLERKSTPDGGDDLERGTVLLVAYHGKYSTVQYMTCGGKVLYRPDGTDDLERGTVLLVVYSPRDG